MDSSAIFAVIVLGIVAFVVAALVQGAAREHAQVMALRAEIPGTDPFIPRYRKSGSSNVYGQDRYKPEGAWLPLTERIKVAGVHYRTETAHAWLDQVQRAEAGGRPYGIILVPEPRNAHDQNAIKVVGHVEGRADWHIGYVPQELARSLADGPLRRGVKIVGTLYSIYHRSDDDLEVNFMVLGEAGKVPSLSQRATDPDHATDNI